MEMEALIRREDRIKEKILKDTAQIEKADQQIQRLIARKKRQECKIKKKTRKEDAHEKIVMGGVVRSVLGRDFEKGDAERLLNFLKWQERNGNYFTKAMNQNKET